MQKIPFKMKCVALAACAAVCAANAVPSVQNVTISQNGVEGRVDVTYELGGAPAIVTVDFLTNGVSIGEANFASVWGDVNRMVSDDGVHGICWRPDREWGGNLADVTAIITAWDPESPPDYLVVGLETQDDVRYYVSTNALPDGGLSNDIYRRFRIVMRKIPAKGVQWRMGAPANEPGQKTKDSVTTDTETIETPHLVTLTNDYYMAIYELTYRQYVCIVGWGSYFSNVHTGDDRFPADNLNYNNVRGSGWPAQGHGDVGSGTFLAQIRAKTGVDFDLPTEAEWEYACRAGTSTGFNNGQELKYMNSTGSLDPLAWYYNAGSTHVVGLKAPNAWGLYDMHGNVWEYCLDWVAGSDGVIVANTETTSPNGLASGSYRSGRGGGFGTAAYKCRSGYRAKVSPSQKSQDQGVRLICPVGLKYPTAAEE